MQEQLADAENVGPDQLTVASPPKRLPHATRGARNDSTTKEAPGQPSGVDFASGSAGSGSALSERLRRLALTLDHCSELEAPKEEAEATLWRSAQEREAWVADAERGSTVPAQLYALRCLAFALNTSGLV